MTAKVVAKRFSTALYWGTFALIVASFLVRQRLHGLAFPPPWPDESSFLWPALAFADTGTLYSPELFRSRELMWMPPGYMVLSGVIFKLTGFSLEWARALSGLYLCGAFACVAAMAQRLRGRWGYLGLTLLFLHSPIAVMAGNTARMETLLLLTSAAAFLLFERGRRATSLSLLALAPLIHPNGVFPLAGGALLCLLPVRGNLARLRPQQLELIAVLAAAACWLAYGVHVVNHFQAWLADWSFQLRWKQFQSQEVAGVVERLKWPGLWIPALILALSGGAAAGSRSPEARTIAPLSVFAASLWLQTLLTVGWLYEVYAIFMQFLVTLVAVELIGLWLAERRGTTPRSIRAVCTVLALLAGAVSAAFVVASDFAMRSVTPATRGIWPAPPAYMRGDDRAAVAQYLRALARDGKPITVNFLPDADALVFHDLRSSTVRFSQPAFGVELADVYIFHDSVWLPQLLRNMLLLRVGFTHGVPIPLEQWPLIHQRDGTESWRFYRRP